MFKSMSPAERVAGMLADISTAVEVLFKHANKAISLRDKANRTTVMGSGTGPDALPAKGDVIALVQKMPGTADEDYDDVEDAKELRGTIVKSIGGFMKTVVKKATGKISDALHDSTIAPLGKLHGNNLKSIEHIKSALIALQAGIEEMAGAMTGATRKACILRFDIQIKGVIGEYEKVTKLNEIVNMTRQPKMLSLILVSSLGEVSIALRGNQLILEALGCDVPEEWQLKTRQEELEKDPEGLLVDLLIEERLDELRELSIQAELCEFEPYPELAEDEAKLVNYALRPCRSLELQVNAYHEWKTKAYAWDRDSTAVVEVTAQSDTSSLLRFLGFYQQSADVTVKGSKELTTVHPSKLRAYCEFLFARPAGHTWDN